MLTKLLRGSAELLGDEMPGNRQPVGDTGAMAVAPAANTDGDAEDEVEDDADGSFHSHVLSTGRAAVWATLRQEDREFLEELRYNVLAFLAELDDTLIALQSAGAAAAIAAAAIAAAATAAAASDAAAADGVSGAAEKRAKFSEDTAGGASSGGFGGLANSIPVRSAWLKLGKIAVGRRMTALKVMRS